MLYITIYGSLHFHINPSESTIHVKQHQGGTNASILNRYGEKTEQSEIVESKYDNFNFMMGLEIYISVEGGIIIKEDLQSVYFPM